MVEIEYDMEYMDRSFNTAAEKTSGTHYENPPCMPDEKAVRIMGIAGVFCSPSCGSSPCPTDVPEGVTVAPQCALQSPTGDKFCAIICSPSSTQTSTTDASFLRANNAAIVGGGDCGPMNCVPIPQAAGMGICVYDGSSDTRASTTDIRSE